MPITQSELESFHRFAIERVKDGNVESITDLADEWDAQVEELDAYEAIRRGIADMEAGRVIPVEAMIAQMRSEFGFK